MPRSGSRWPQQGHQIVEGFGGEAIPFLQRPEWFRAIYVGSEAWQTVGWGTILYLAALTIAIALGLSWAVWSLWNGGAS